MNGSGRFSESQDGCIQAVAEQRRYVTGEESCWLIYTKQQVVSYRFTSGWAWVWDDEMIKTYQDQQNRTESHAIGFCLCQGEVLQAIGYFPAAPVWKLPSGTLRWGGRRSDVWSTHCDLPQIQKLLDQHAALTNDRQGCVWSVNVSEFAVQTS